jgi:hypothetical protein
MYSDEEEHEEVRIRGIVFIPKTTEMGCKEVKFIE